MTYNSLVLHEQGGSVLRVDSGGSISLQAGGAITGTGTVTAASITVSDSGAFQLGANVQVMFAASAAAPSGLPVSASPGAIFFRSDGANSAGYVNTSDGVSGSVWTIFSEL